MSDDLTSNLLESKEGLFFALSRVIDTTSEHDKAREEYEGYSWGYMGSGHIFAMEKARKDFIDRLNALVDARVAVALADAMLAARERTGA